MRTLYLHIHTHTYMYVWSRAPRPPPNGWKATPSPPPVVWGLVGRNPPPSFPPCGGFWWVGIALPPSPCRVGFVLGSLGGVEPVVLPDLLVVVKLLLRQTVFCGRRFCSESLGCPFRFFGRPWRFLLETIQYRVIESVLMISRPPIIYYTLCYILYTINSRVYTIYYRLYYVYMVCLYTIARPLKGGNQVLHTSLRATWKPDYSILQHTIVQHIMLQSTIVYYTRL